MRPTSWFENRFPFSNLNSNSPAKIPIPTQTEAKKKIEKSRLDIELLIDCNAKIQE